MLTMLTMLLSLALPAHAVDMAPGSVVDPSVLRRHGFKLDADHQEARGVSEFAEGNVVWSATFCPGQPLVVKSLTEAFPSRRLGDRISKAVQDQADALAIDVSYRPGDTPVLVQTLRSCETFKQERAAYVTRARAAAKAERDLVKAATHARAANQAAQPRQLAAPFSGQPGAAWKESDNWGRVEGGPLLRRKYHFPGYVVGRWTDTVELCPNEDRIKRRSVEPQEPIRVGSKRHEKQAALFFERFETMVQFATKRFGEPVDVSEKHAAFETAHGTMVVRYRAEIPSTVATMNCTSD